MGLTVLFALLALILAILAGWLSEAKEIRALGFAIAFLALIHLLAAV